jgi:transposase IS66 family protein
MKRHNDGNTGNSRMVYFEKGTLHTDLPLDRDYCHDALAYRLGQIGLLLKDIAQRYYDEVLLLKEENARLNKRAARPQLKPSVIAKEDKDYQQAKKKRTQRVNPNKKQLPVTQSTILKPCHPVPSGSRFKGYKDFYVQEIDIKTHYLCYRRERWKTPNGNEILGELPDSIEGCHFGPTLRQFILYQYFHNVVTQPLLLNQLRDMGISISSGQLSNLLTKKNTDFLDEKNALLKKGLSHSDYIQVDDTGARHRGKNGFCTQIGNQNFTFFKSSNNKSKHNFLSILQGNNIGYRLNQTAHDYLKRLKGFSNWDLFSVEYHSQGEVIFTSENEWLTYLHCQPYSKGSYKALTEAAMIGYLSQDIFRDNLIILSDEAKQFDINNNAACWVHAERKLTKVIPEGTEQSRFKERKLSQFWRLYKALKLEMKSGDISSRRKCQLRIRFENLCKPLANFKKLNAELVHLYSMKLTLFRALESRAIPLHNNLSESDIRELRITANVNT